ncbi:hypothetical protein [Bythopirellula goksoeyrii]|uniref:Uncharacterized protein n=1 Tax=Bythopirellula goksoeyrii TaxID=1400387 RepID=A0A5B9QFZ8_9BACT|nr:hypothetical protein [Bythopirellula goksoeyrii]QEG33271.1 hypothetical protein Pr1d_05320 [Bythopirellula goksoeyrii]
MPEILFHYERVNPTSWAYLSSLLMLALYFKFNRVFSVRNFDLFLLILFAPGLLLVQWSWENAGVAENALQIEYLGFLWLLTVELLWLTRLLMDTWMVRRPLLEPNLNAAGLLFMGSSLLFFLMANVVTGEPNMEDLLPARQAEEVRIEETIGDEQDSFATDGPGFFLLYRMPRISTQTLIGAAPQTERPTTKELDRRERIIQEATARVMAILSHVLIVVGLVLVGYLHFDNITMGISAATTYLLLPYTALWTGSVEHAMPAALLVWAIVLYRRPLLAGMLIGLASGTIYYPAFLIPLWCSFYWDRGIKRFATGVVLMIGILVLTLAFTATDTQRFLDHLLQMFGLRLPTTANLQGIWQFWNPVFRYPVLAAFVALSFSFTIWPFQKNLATLISCSAAIMVAAQFWHAYDGGVFIAWFLPLLLLTIFRPNLEDRTALIKVSEGWWQARQRAKGGT